MSLYNRNLRSSRETDDFSENDLNRWMQQLKELKLETTSSLSVELIEDERSFIHLIAIHDKSTTNKNFESSQNDSPIKQSSNLVTQERFSKVIGPAKLDEEGLLAKHNNDKDRIYANVVGRQHYSQGRQTVRSKIE